MAVGNIFATDGKQDQLSLLCLWRRWAPAYATNTCFSGSHGVATVGLQSGALCRRTRSQSTWEDLARSRTCESRTRARRPSTLTCIFSWALSNSLWRSTLTDHSPQFHMESMLHQWTPITWFKSEPYECGVNEDHWPMFMFWGEDTTTKKRKSLGVIRILRRLLSLGALITTARFRPSKVGIQWSIFRHRKHRPSWRTFPCTLRCAFFVSTFMGDVKFHALRALILKLLRLWPFPGCFRNPCAAKGGRQKGKTRKRLPKSDPKRKWLAYPLSPTPFCGKLKKVLPEESSEELRNLSRITTFKSEDREWAFGTVVVGFRVFRGSFSAQRSQNTHF